MTLSLRKARAEDAKKVYDWRNDETVRLASIDTREISWTEHEDWFQHSLQRQDRYLLIAEKENLPVGVLRLDISADINGNVAEVSIFTDPALVGQGLGTLMLQQGVRWSKKNLKDLFMMRAKVRPENIASIRIFEKAGFEIQDAAETWQVYQLVV